MTPHQSKHCFSKFSVFVITHFHSNFLFFYASLGALILLAPQSSSSFSSESSSLTAGWPSLAQAFSMAASRNCKAACMLLMSLVAPVTKKTFSIPESSMPVRRRFFSVGHSTGIPRYSFVLRMTRSDPAVLMTSLDEEGGADVFALTSATSLSRRRPRPRSCQVPVAWN
jgi:hypothetical protein